MAGNRTSGGGKPWKAALWWCAAVSAMCAHSNDTSRAIQHTARKRLGIRCRGVGMKPYSGPPRLGVHLTV